MKILILTAAFLGAGFSYGQGLGLPTQAQLEQQGVETNFPENNLPEDWDTRLPNAGEIRLLAEILLQEAKQKIEAQQASVPDGANGKQSTTYIKITQWLQEVDVQLATKTRVKLLDLNPLNAELLKSARSEEDLDESVLGLVGLVQSTTKGLIYNGSDFFKENQNPDVSQHDKLLVGFYCSDFIEEPEWEDEPLPIDPAGVFVIDQNNATTKLKTKTLDEIKTFLGGDTDNGFFERYEAAGDGMDILKTRYAANKVAIQAKFAEVLAHVAQLENQQ